MARKTRLRLTDPAYVPAAIASGEPAFSGADMEAALTRAKFRAAALGEEQVSPEVLEATIADFIPPTYPEEIELQNLCAVLECTSRDLLPEPWKSTPREAVMARIDALRNYR
jgi:hypothetical protein